MGCRHAAVRGLGGRYESIWVPRKRGLFLFMTIERSRSVRSVVGLQRLEISVKKGGMGEGRTQTVC